MSRIRTCLWFEKNGENAAKFYCDLIPRSQIESRFAPDPANEALLISFSLDGVPYQILNGGPQFSLSEAASIVYRTVDQAETDRVWEALLGTSGVEHACGWLRDQFGMEWQIVPDALIEALASPDREGASRAQAAMMSMKKIDIAAIERAFRGE